jgi:DNA/RNA endonuclease YhcR with UshA esterase domain
MKITPLSFVATLGLLAVGTLGFAQPPAPPQGAPPTGATQATPTPAPDPADALPWVTVADASAMATGSYVYVRAKLDAMQPPRPNSRAPWNLHVSDNTGTMKVVIFQDVYSQIQNPTEIFQPGVTLELFVEASEYRGERQLVVTRPAYVRVKAGSRAITSKFRAGGSGGFGTNYTPVTIMTLNRQAVGRGVRIKGTITNLDPSPGGSLPTKMVLTDDTGSVIVIYWKEIGDQIDKSVKIAVGEQIEISGVATEFENTIQVRIDDGTLVKRP